MIIFKNSTEKKLLLLQRNEFLSPKQVKLRKLFGRSLFTSHLINYFQDSKIHEKVFNQIQDEFDVIKQYLPRSASTIMDIGCGIGLIDIFLNNYYEKIKNFYLLDKNHIDRKIVYGFSENYESYNKFDITKNFLINNGINENKLKLINVDRQFEIKENSIDLCLSLVSMGYHYPIKQYIDLLKNISKEKTVFIFDIATEYQNLESLSEFFEQVQIIEKTETKHPRLRVACQNIIR